jgi:3-hydroxy-9,10-secoandrosta-1,3,5(10)-triene-9,17-dione monooxygenase reductase component
MRPTAPAAPPARDGVAAEAYRQAIANFATGVTVITSLNEDQPCGMTASAVSSLSLDPILLLVCISSRLPTGLAISRRRRFAVNVLGASGEHLARQFARPAPDKFAGIDIAHNDGGMPILNDAIAHFVCDVEQELEGGDHTIFIGRVIDCGCASEGKPLLYFRSAFGRLETPDDYMARMWHLGGLNDY